MMGALLSTAVLEKQLNQPLDFFSFYFMAYSL
jgi:hypothetical protein